jgi:hypothetical protein
VFTAGKTSLCHSKYIIWVNQSFSHIYILEPLRQPIHCSTNCASAATEPFDNIPCFTWLKHHAICRGGCCACLSIIQQHMVLISSQTARKWEQQHELSILINSSLFACVTGTSKYYSRIYSPLSMHWLLGLWIVYVLIIGCWDHPCTDYWVCGLSVCWPSCMSISMNTSI